MTRILQGPSSHTPSRGEGLRDEIISVDTGWVSFIPPWLLSNWCRGCSLQSEPPSMGRDCSFRWAPWWLTLGVSLTHLRSWEPQLKNCLHQIGLWSCVRDIFLNASWCRSAQPTMGSRYYAWVNEAGLYKQLTKHVPASQSVTILSWFLLPAPCLEFLPQLSPIMDCDLEV